MPRRALADRAVSENAGLTEDQRVAAAEALIAAREQRDAIFGRDLFADPAWNMLIRLYAGGPSGRIAVSALCSASGVPHATALRWLGSLEKRGLAARVPDATDGRRMFVILTEPAKRGVEAVLDRLAAG